MEKRKAKIRTREWYQLGFGILLGLSFCLLSFIACQKQNNPPTISSISGSTTISVSSIHSYICHASDLDGDTLSYQWSCTAGTLSSSSSDSVQWTAPSSPGTHTISVIVSDGKGGADSTAVIITVNANAPPVISSITGSTSVDAGSTNTYTCNATDTDGDSLIYSWTCSVGSLSQSTGKTVSWTAPIQSGTAVLTVTVRDGKGGVDSQGVSITVNQVTTQWIRWDGAVQAGYYTYWSQWIDAGYTMSGTFSVDAHDINFFIFDETNYNNWVNRQNWTALVNAPKSTGSNFNTAISVSGIYYVVLDNTYSIITDKFCHITANLTSP